MYAYIHYFQFRIQYGVELFTHHSQIMHDSEIFMVTFQFYHQSMTFIFHLRNDQYFFILLQILRSWNIWNYNINIFYISSWGFSIQLLPFVTMDGDVDDATSLNLGEALELCSSCHDLKQVRMYKMWTGNFFISLLLWNVTHMVRASNSITLNIMEWLCG